MATKDRRVEPDLAKVKAAAVRRLMVKLEEAHRAGTLKPVSTKAKPVAMAIRVKVAA